MGYSPSVLKHHYGSNVVILNNPAVNTLLTDLSHENCLQPRFNRHLKSIYKQLILEAINCFWPLEKTQTKTRMTEQHPDVRLTSEVLNQKLKAVVVDIARAGMIPSQIAFDLINELVPTQGVRQDHIFASRATNSENKVTHTELSSSKVGEELENRIVFLPDPMGATGNSVAQILDFYKKKKEKAAQYIAIHMIITPEYIHRLKNSHPELKVVCARLDRGLSEDQILKSELGEFPGQEKGLNAMDYIVPGAGGVGEIINNCFV